MPKGHKGQSRDFAREVRAIQRQLILTNRRIDDLDRRLDPFADHLAATEREMLDLSGRVTRLERRARR